MNRRQILQVSMATGLAAALSTVASGVAYAVEAAEIRKPRRLKAGNTIGLIAPASNVVEDETIRFAGDVIRSLGFSVKEGAHLFDRDQYLAGDDRARAADVNDMFQDEDVDAIFCLRGGYGTPRILPYLDYDAIAQNAKVLLGYSDITAILLAIYSKTGLIGFHGQNASRNYSDYTLAEFKKVLVNPSADAIIGAPPAQEAREGWAENRNRVTRINGGIAQGRLIGGNLSLVASLIGTAYEPDFRDCILFLEDAGEAPYRIDRMLTQLWLAGKLEQVSGIALGKFTNIDRDPENTFSLEEVFRMRCEPLGIPTIRGLMSGHVGDQTVVPIGISAELDADAGSLRLLEPAVI